MNRLKFSLEFLGYKYNKAEKFIEKLPAYGSDEYVSNMENQRWEIYHFMKLNNLKYSSFIDDRSIKVWDDIPIMTKAVLKHDLEGWITKSYQKSKLYHNHTSGSSSGQPFHIYKDKLCHGITWCEIVNIYHELAGVEIGKDKYGRFMGIAPNSRLVITLIKDCLANRITYDTFRLGAELYEKATRDIRSLKIKYLYGYASAVSGYARYLYNNPSAVESVSGKLKAVIVTSEMCRDYDFQLIKRVFGVPVYNEYGCSEFGVLGVGRDLDRLEMRGRHLWVEVVDDMGRSLPPEIPGRIVVSSLFNYAFPFIRFDIGDIGAIRVEGNRRYLTKLQGRSNEQFELADGTMISVLTIEFAIDQIYECCPGLMEYQLVFFTRDRCEFRYVSNQTTPDVINQQMVTILKGFMGKQQGIAVSQVDFIPKGAAGKSQNILKLY